MHTLGPQTLHPPGHNGLIHKELWHTAFTTFDTNFKMSGRFSFLYGGFSAVGSKSYSCIWSQNRSLKKDISSVLQNNPWSWAIFADDYCICLSDGCVHHWKNWWDHRTGIPFPPPYCRRWQCCILEVSAMLIVVQFVALRSTFCLSKLSWST